MLRGYTLGWLGAIIVVVSAATVIVVGILRGGGASDEQAVRAWFESPAGGGAPHSVVSAIHVGTCSPADATSPGPVFMCPITTDAGTTPSPLPDTCFKFAGDRVASGGWQLAPVDHCNALRFDSRTGELVDIPGDARYRITRS
jgi:hypothetical protein